MRWLMTWVDAWRTWRLLKLSCKLDLHYTVDGRCACDIRADRQFAPVWSPD